MKAIAICVLLGCAACGPTFVRDTVPVVTPSSPPPASASATWANVEQQATALCDPGIAEEKKWGPVFTETCVAHPKDRYIRDCERWAVMLDKLADENAACVRATLGNVQSVPEAVLYVR